MREHTPWALTRLRYSDGTAWFVDCSVRSPVRNNPALTMVAVMPNGATSARSASVQPSRPNFDAA